MTKANLLQANSLQIPLADGVVHCVVTSPPYWGLRQYAGTSSWVGGDPTCDHTEPTHTIYGNKSATFHGSSPDGQKAHQRQYRDTCRKCGAQRIDAQLGSEPLHDCLGWATGAPCGECFICHMVAVFAEVWRVLRDDACCWVNIGDSYAANRPAGQPAPTNTGNRAGYLESSTQGIMKVPPGLKPKDLCLIPQRLALALQSFGWYVRSEIIWAKKAPMPESVRDRPTKAHEQIWLLTKSERYWYDADAVREAILPASIERAKSGFIGDSERNKNGVEAHHGKGFMRNNGEPVEFNPAGRNLRTVWHLGPEPFSANSKIYRARRVGRDALSDGMKHIVFPGCPVHGAQFAQVATEFCGEHEGEKLTRILRTADHLAQERRSGYVPTPQHPDAAISRGTWGYFPRMYSPSAIDHNSEIHRMALALDSNPAYIAFAEIADRTDDRSKLLASFVQHLCIYGSSILPDETDARLLDRTPGRTVDRFSLPIPPECECMFYEYYTKNSDHFAVFPSEIPERCIKAATSERGCCPVCGKQWERVTEDTRSGAYYSEPKDNGGAMRNDSAKWAGRIGEKKSNTLGFRPTCTCPPAEPIPALVLDPFNGAGTSGLVAQQLGRRYVGLDLSGEYLRMSQKRLGHLALDEWQNGKAADNGASLANLPMFAELDQ